MSKESITTSQEVRPRRHFPSQLGLAEKDRAVLHIVYGLYALSLVTALLSLLGAGLAYLKRPDIRGSCLGCRATWQLCTFFTILISWIISAALVATFLLIPIAFIVSGLTWL